MAIVAEDEDHVVRCERKEDQLSDCWKYLRMRYCGKCCCCTMMQLVYVIQELDV
jgi:hypothetical protein